MRPADVRRIWYASYGSNLKHQRFMCYIQGGIPEGRTEPNSGSRDTNPPRESRPVSLKFDLYFAARSAAWGNGGVGFIREGTKDSLVLGRMYLITDDQFNDVVMQENSRAVDGSRFVPPYEQLVKQHESILPGNPLYGRLVNTGTEGGYPIITFTTARTDLPINTPSENYVKTIAAGVKETYPEMRDDAIAAYLQRAEGIRDRIPPEQLQRWVAEATQHH